MDPVPSKQPTDAVQQQIGAIFPADLVQNLCLDHIGIACADLELASVPYFALGLQAQADEILPQQGVRLRCFQLNDLCLELITPLAETSSLQRFLQKKGAGLHHLAFRVPDVQALWRYCVVHDIPCLGEPHHGRAGSLVFFVHPSWANGTLIEWVQVSHTP